MTTAVVLGIARAVGETAPLLFTAFGYDLMNANPTSGAQESLPLFVYRNIRKPDVSAVDRGFAGALVLMLIVLEPVRPGPLHRPRPQQEEPSTRPPRPPRLARDRPQGDHPMTADVPTSAGRPDPAAGPVS